MKVHNFKLKKDFLAMILLLCFVLLTSCPVNAAGENISKQLLIAVIPERADLDFWQLLKKEQRVPP